MSKRETKKEHILNHGIEVMMEKGYNGTSVKDIVDAACVPKGSFYNYFESKVSFAIDALEEVSCRSFESSRQLLSDESKPALQRLHTFFQAGAEWMTKCEFKGGCFVGNIAQEMSDSNEVIRLKVRQIFKRNTQLVADALEEAKKQGDVAESLDTSLAAEFLFNAWEGSLMRMKASKCCEPIDAFLKTWPQLVA